MKRALVGKGGPHNEQQCTEDKQHLMSVPKALSKTSPVTLFYMQDLHGIH